jgi:hypothetical protein
MRTLLVAYTEEVVKSIEESLQDQKEFFYADDFKKVIDVLREKQAYDLWLRKVIQNGKVFATEGLSPSNEMSDNYPEIETWRISSQEKIKEEKVLGYFLSPENWEAGKEIFN